MIIVGAAFPYLLQSVMILALCFLWVAALLDLRSHMRTGVTSHKILVFIAISGLAQEIAVWGEYLCNLQSCTKNSQGVRCPYMLQGRALSLLSRPTIYGPGSLGHLTRPALCYEDSSSCWRFLAHLASAAFLAISLRRSGDSFSARALPPLLAPSFPSATAAGFFSSAMQ
jgi:hypothetical protein